MRRYFAFLMIGLLLFGCIDGGNGGENQDENGEANFTTHIEITDSSQTSIKEGEGDIKETQEGDFNPSEYTETPDAVLYIYFVNVGVGSQGDAILIKKGDFDMLVDTGPAAAEATITNYLLDRGVDDLEVLVLTHDDEEHTANLAYLADRFEVGEIWWNGQGKIELSTEIQNVQSEQIKTVVKGDSFEYNSISITVLNPLPEGERFYHDDGDAIVLKIEDKDTCVLLTSDILFSAQQIVAQEGTCQIVQLPFHGLSIGSGLGNNFDFFVDALQPEAMIVSGSQQTWEDTREMIFRKLDNKGILYYENYKGRAVKITISQEGYTIEND